MRILIFAALALCFAPIQNAKADSQAGDPESILAALRSPDKGRRIGALNAIPSIPGYPHQAEDLLPALLWMADGDDPDLATMAQAQATALGWPGTYCLPCVRRLAAREDLIFKMMALSMLVKLAWQNPAAMAILLEVNRNHTAGNGAMVHKYASLLGELSCGTDPDMELWNSHAGHFLGRMIESLQAGGKKCGRSPKP